ncbi:hypothetical protein C8N35_101720 [Breoghania corrubedonensis]|uniref:Uncharacterized protein n=1 Tax=Breoghania corrubedonensis TaxID=665038 RepID=A0A2T5VFZ0_9HYPH|nr:hypothetical protein [Breoghania corrubedonensis]PTW62673.1 hypothetical protein C8N35_101720 [Breoghania corrubedonensis]
MAHIDYRTGLIILLPLVLLFLAGLAAGVVAAFLICNLPLLKRMWDKGGAMSFALSASLSLTLTVLIGSVLSGLLLKLGLFGNDVYVPESFPLFLARPTLEFFLVMLASLALAFLAFGFLRRSSELVQRVVVPVVFIAVFVLGLALVKTWSSYWILADQFDTDLFAGTLYQMVYGELATIGGAFATLGDAFSANGGGLFGRLFQSLGGELDTLWNTVRNAGGNQFVLVEAFPVIFAVSSLVALVYMVLRWPFTAFSHAKDEH